MPTYTPYREPAMSTETIPEPKLSRAPIKWHRYGWIIALFSWLPYVLAYDEGVFAGHTALQWWLTISMLIYSCIVGAWAVYYRFDDHQEW